MAKRNAQKFAQRNSRSFSHDYREVNALSSQRPLVVAYGYKASLSHVPRIKYDADAAGVY